MANSIFLGIVESTFICSPLLIYVKRTGVILNVYVKEA